MERFAFKIDKVLRANLYKICRLCGIDNPDKVPILKENEVDVVDVEAEPELSQKIHDCVGFLIKKDDKMPQMICSLCVDKINDFYEFREMCFATNIQTRKLLGLKDPPKKNVEIKVEVKTEPPPATVDRRSRKRKSEDIPVEAEVKVENEKPKLVSNSILSKKRARLAFSKENKKFKDNPVAEPEKVKTEIKNEMPVETILALTTGNKNLKEICKICNERFGSKYKLDRHKFLTHAPNIPRYVCTTCDETLKKNGEIRSHQLWHKLTKTPYTCALCRETTSTINLYTRHMREHAQKLATQLIVLDRQCAQCHSTFCTNFLYNTHPCAVRTRKCGGCNRQIKNEVDYQRHASTCEKAYLMISKHLSAALEPVRIKNENDVEAAAESLGINAIAPTTVATPTTSNVVDSNVSGEIASQPNKSTKKGSKKGISKKDLKRVDDLLKSTMDALVSIKHEPEMHVESDAPNHPEQQDNVADEAENVASHTFEDDDFQNRDDFSDDGDNDAFVPIVQLQTGNDILIKQELTDSIDQESVNAPKSPNVVTIKKELPDSGYEDSSATGSIAKVPVLKLKITKEHGTLNSSLVNESPTSREKKKKKKKRKDIDKTNDQIDHNENPQEGSSNSPEVSPTKSSDQMSMPLPGVIRIKQERLDDDYPGENTENEPQDAAGNLSADGLMQPEATVMTSIPMMQLQIACVSSGVDFNEANGEKEQQQDVKPNRAELDRWLEINSSTSTTENSELELEQEMHETEETNVSNVLKPRQNHRSQHVYKTPCRSKALKSTGGITRQGSSVQEIPKIVAVSSGFDAIAAHNDNSANSHNFAMPNVVVKAEPRDDGYENSTPTDELMNSDQEMETPMPFESQTEDVNSDEQAFINSIDFNNICIKQEKDIDVSESQLTAQHIPANLYNATEDIVMEALTTTSNNIEQSNETEDTDDDDEVEDEDEEMELDVEDDNLEREYRELEWPPPLIEPKKEIAENNPMSLGLVISSVCSQADEIAADKHKSDISLRSVGHFQNMDENHQSENVLENKLSIFIEEKPIQTDITENEIHRHFGDAPTTEIPHLKILENTVPINDFSRSKIGGIYTSAEQGIAKEIPILKGASISIDSFTALESEREEPEFDKNEDVITSMSLKFVQDSENLLETSPCSKSINNESNMEMNLTLENIDEEQQNILNHEVLANSELQANTEMTSMGTLNQPTTFPPAIPATQTQFSPIDGFEDSRPGSAQPITEKCSTSAILSDSNEETDNFFNENVDAADHQRLPDQEAMYCMSVAFNAQNLLQQRALLLDDSNINEIAENNNNANIERELLDDNSNNAERMSPPIEEQVTNNDEVT